MIGLPRWVHRVLDSVLVAAAVLAVWGLVGTLLGSRSVGGAGTTSTGEEGVRSTVHEPQVLFLYFASSDCPVCARGDTKKAVAALASKIERHAELEGVRVLRIGGTLDWDVARGMNDLTSVDDWDEVVLGSNWANRMVMDFLWSKGAEPIVPQVAVFGRVLTIEPSMHASERSVEELARFEGRIAMLQALELDPSTFLDNFLSRKMDRDGG